MDGTGGWFDLAAEAMDGKDQQDLQPRLRAGNQGTQGGMPHHAPVGGVEGHQAARELPMAMERAQAPSVSTGAAATPRVAVPTDMVQRRLSGRAEPGPFREAQGKGATTASVAARTIPDTEALVAAGTGADHGAGAVVPWSGGGSHDVAKRAAALPTAMVRTTTAPTDEGGVVATKSGDGADVVVGDGSRCAQELEEARRAAGRAVAWLEHDHPSWLGAISASSRILDEGVRQSVANAKLVRFGAAYIDNARATVHRYDEWAAARSDSIVAADSEDGVGYPPSAELVEWFILDQTLAAARKAKGKGKTFKATVAKSLVTKLGYANKAFGAPFDVEALREAPVTARDSMAGLSGGFLAIVGEDSAGSTLSGLERIAMADDDLTGIDDGEGDATRALSEEEALRKLVREATEDSAHWAVAQQCHVEALASSTAIDDVQRDFARGLVVLGLTGMRGVEGLRSRVCDAGTSEYVTLMCSGGYKRRCAQQKPFLVWCPRHGFLGELEWLDEWIEEYSRRAYIFGAYKKGGVAGWIWGARMCAAPEALKAMYEELMGMAPLCYPKERMVRGQATLYGTRHLLPDVARVAGMRREDRGELGRWVVAEADDEAGGAVQSLGMTTRAAKRPKAARKPSKAATQQDNYSRTEAARSRQVTLRRKAARIVFDFIARAMQRESAAGWAEVIPMQRDEEASFDFLVEKAEDEDSSEGSADDDAEPEAPGMLAIEMRVEG